MNVLMISLGDQVLQNELGDTAERHIKYAKECQGSVHMVTYSLRSRNLTEKKFEDCFFVYPSRSLHYATFPLDAVRIITNLCKRKVFHIIYSQDPFGTALAGLYAKIRFKIPLIIGNHSSFIDNPYWISERRWFFSFLNAMGKQLLRYADAYRVINETEKCKYVHGIGIEPRKIHVIPTPVNNDQFKAAVDLEERKKLREEWNITSEQPVMIWVGRPVRVKRLPLLFEAFKKVKHQYADAILFLVGNEKQAQEKLRSTISAMGLSDSIRWANEGVPHSQLRNYYQMADIYVHASNYEGFGKVLVEASASGLPVVATRTAAAELIVKNGKSGFVVDIEDSEGLAESIKKLIADPEKRKEMGREARNLTLDQFDQEKSIKHIVHMWAQYVRNTDLMGI